ncbi:TRAP transporter small permease [bacterium LRH843]|nr:TRAP transporter small permease [bacterium LRH843]
MEKVSRFLNGIMTAVITLFLVAMIVLVFLNVVLRYGFDSGITESEELSRYLFVWIVFLGAMIAHKEKGHLGVDLLIGALPAKVQKVMYTIVNIIVIGVLVIVIDGSLKMVAINSNSYGPATGIPLSILFYAGLLASVSMIILSIMQTVKYVFYNEDAPVWAKIDKKGGKQ